MRLGGVEDPTRARVETGLEPHKRTVFWFRCPVCAHEARQDVAMEPMCTGPSWTNDHEPTVMARVW